MTQPVFKRGLSLFLAFLMCFTTLLSIGKTTVFAAGERGEAVLIGYPRGGDANRSDITWGHDDLTFMNGWFSEAIRLHEVYSMNSYSGNICYCIEPGTKLEVGDIFEQKDETFFDSYPSEYNHTITPNEIKNFFGRILHYGYTGAVSPNWMSQNPEEANIISEVIATQILIWETVVGERDSSFAHVSTGGYNAVYDIIRSDHPLKNLIKDNYDRIVGSVQKHTVLPSFFTRSSGTAQNIELEWNGSQYISVLTDTNNVLSNYSYSASDPNVKCTVSGNKLTIASNEALSGTVSITASKTNSYRKGVLIWSDGNYAPGAGKQDTVTYGQDVEDPVKGFLNIKVSYGSAKIVKTSEDGKVAGVSFTITGNGVNKTVTTNNKGEVQIDNLTPGIYKVTELVEDKYEPQEVRNVTVVSGKTATVTFNNVLKRGELQVIKTSEDNMVEGVKFHLYGVSLSGHTVDEYAVTDKNGIATFKDVLASGHASYTIEEIDTAERYIVPESQRTPVEWNKVVKKSFYNELKRGDLSVKKTAEDGFVQGMKFHISGISLSGIAVDEYAVTDANGIARFNDILIGSGYTIEEVNTPVRYVVPKHQSADIAWDELTETAFENILKKWRADVRKFDTELTNGSQGDAVLSDAVYGVYKGGELIDTYKTDKNGSFVTKYYVCGDDWSIREVAPSEGYLLDPTVYPVGAEAKNFSIELNKLYSDVFEKVIKGNVAIIKHTDDGETQIETPEAGAKFEVFLKQAGSYENAKVSERDILTCDENGFAQTKDMPYGVYTVHQTKGWDGRKLMDDFDVYISKNETTYRYLINNANFESYVRIVKVDAETNKTIPYAGAAFKIFDPNGEPITMAFTYPTPATIDTFYTDANGSLVTPERLPYGNGYYLVEVEAPYGYVLDSSPVYFDVTEDDSETDENGVIVIKLSKANMAQKGVVTVTKTGEIFSDVSVDGDGGDAIYQPIYKDSVLMGAVFEIRAAEDIITPDGTVRYTKGEIVDTITTGTDGIAKSKEIYLGKYEVQEITAPYGYVIGKEIHSIELIYAGQNISVTESGSSFYNERQKATLSMQKELETNELFDIGSNGEINNVVFGLYAAEKLESESGASIPSDGLIEVITFDKNGLATIKTDLPLGKYYVKEIATDERYILNSDQYAFAFEYVGQDIVSVSLTVNGGEPIDNDLIYGSVSGRKITEHSDALVGAVIGLFKKDETEFTKDTALIMTISQKDGSFSFNNIPYGDWVVREIEQPVGFVLNDTVYDAVIRENEQVIEIEIINEFIMGDISLTKTDADYPENKLSGAIFEIYQDNNADEILDDNDTLLGTLTEGEAGVYEMLDLRYGHYLIKESAAPEGFLLDEDIYPIFIDTNEKVYIIESVVGIGFINKPIKGSITLTKVDAEYPDNKLTGAIFEVYKDNNENEILDDGDKLIGTLAEAETGIYEMLDLRYGHYLIKEIIAPEGFLPDDGVYPVFIDTDEKVYTIDNAAGIGFINQPIKGNIVLTKTDAEYPDNKLTGATFEVYQDNNANEILDDGDKLVGTLTENETGLYEMENLRYGHYLIKETIAPEGFLLDDGVYPVFIDTDEKVYTIDNAAGIGFINQPIKGNIVLTKVDAEYPDNKLTGAAFEVYRDNNANGILDDGDMLIGSLSESKTGVYEMLGLRYGHYLIKETVAPEGFFLDEGAYSLFIERDGATYFVENKTGIGFINEAMKGSLKIVKTSDDGNVEGFSFRITGPDGFDITLKTDKSGEIIIEGLRIGEYTVSEIKNEMTEGYILPGDKAAVVVVNETVTVAMHNERKPEIPETPQTGDNSRLVFWIGSAASSFGALIAVSLGLKKKRNKTK